MIDREAPRPLSIKFIHDAMLEGKEACSDGDSDDDSDDDPDDGPDDDQEDDPDDGDR